MALADLYSEQHKVASRLWRRRCRACWTWKVKSIVGQKGLGLERHVNGRVLDGRSPHCQFTHGSTPSPSIPSVWDANAPHEPNDFSGVVWLVGSTLRSGRQLRNQAIFR